MLNARNISERKASDAERELTENRFRSLVQHSSDLTIVLNAKGEMSYITPAIKFMLGYSPEHLIGQPISAIVPPDDIRVVDEMASLLFAGQSISNQTELRVVGAGGESRILDVILTDLRHDEAVGGIVMNAHDITDRKTLENDLRYKVLHDDLTGIANRVLFRDRVEHAIDGRDEHQKTSRPFFLWMLTTSRQ